LWTPHSWLKKQLFEQIPNWCWSKSLIMGVDKTFIFQRTIQHVMNKIPHFMTKVDLKVQKKIPTKIMENSENSKTSWENSKTPWCFLWPTFSNKSSWNRSDSFRASEVSERWGRGSHGFRIWFNTVNSY
jgi:hypothetical protein